MNQQVLTISEYVYYPVDQKAYFLALIDICCSPGRKKVITELESYQKILVWPKTVLKEENLLKS